MCQLRTLCFVTALAAGLVAAAPPAGAQGQRVTPEAAVVQTLQAIQTAYERKDTAQYSRLIASPVNQIEWNFLGDENQVTKLSRDDFVTKFLGNTEEARLHSPFSDTMPISQRILYAVNIPGGQLVRIIGLNRPVPNTKETFIVHPSTVATRS